MEVVVLFAVVPTALEINIYPPIIVRNMVRVLPDLDQACLPRSTAPVCITLFIYTIHGVDSLVVEVINIKQQANKGDQRSGNKCNLI